MKDYEWEKLEDKGIILEKMFFMDYSVEDDITLRVFQNREQINRMILTEGGLAEKEDEVVLERRYVEVHDIQLGDAVKIGGREFTVTGL